MKTSLLAFLLCPVFLFACGAPESSATRSKSTSSTDSKDKDSNPKDSTDHNGQTGDSMKTTEEDEQAIPPQPLTGMFLSCGKPSVQALAMNIDCTLKNAAKQRVKPSEIADKLVYGVDSTKKDDEVLISTVEGDSNKPYDVRYAVKAKDTSKIESIVDSSTFFVKAFDDKGDEIKDAVKPFFGFDLEMPDWDAIKDTIGDALGRLGI